MGKGGDCALNIGLKLVSIPSLRVDVSTHFIQPNKCYLDHCAQFVALFLNVTHLLFQGFDDAFKLSCLIVHRSARETPAFMPGRDSAAREACPFLSHPPFGLLSLHRPSIMCEWKSSERTGSSSTRRLSKN